MNNMRLIGIYILMFGLLHQSDVISQSVTNSKHNLSISGPGTIKATSESEICIFCHTPHSSRPSGPLWNRNDPGTTYTLYSSLTLDATITQPDGSSILCLSCHDGTIALGTLVSRTTDVDFSGGITTMPTVRGNLTTDLSDDHPISFAYTSAVASGDGQLKDPSAIGMLVQLENGKVQCISCHDPHNDTNGKFLVATKEFSTLCLECHDRTFWSSSSHSASSAQAINGATPWQHIESPYLTVAQNACENCHDPHNSLGNPRLLKAATDENNCLDCHNANVASTNIETEFLKTYSHNVLGYNGIHDPTESTLSSTLHVECQDCHNPHAVNSSAASAPNANGFLAGVRGIDTGGNAVTTISYEYELCYRCHADSPAKPSSPTTRLVDENNVRLEFDLGNPSHHAVEGAGANNNVPSLYNGYTTSSVIYCTDCHASNDAGSPAGPHGSSYPQILKYQYETADNTAESANNYALCYSCHQRSSILADVSFKEHDVHVRGDDIPCNACHDPHGVQGNTTNNTHLINFDLNIVSPNGAFLRFVDTGDRSGYCQLNCHGKSHGPGLDYKP